MDGAVKPMKALYGCIESAALWHEHLSAGVTLGIRTIGASVIIEIGQVNSAQ